MVNLPLSDVFSTLEMIELVNDIEDAYTEIYWSQNLRDSMCPVKIAMPLTTYPNGTVQSEITVQTAVDVERWSSVKVGRWQFDPDRFDIDLILYEPNGTIHRLTNGFDLTVNRTGAMAAFTIKRAFSQPTLLKVGLIGLGRINHSIARYLAQVLRVSKFVLRNSPTNLSGGYTKFQADLSRFGVETELDDTNNYSKLRTCDVIISATTNWRETRQIDYEDIQGAKLYIAADNGFLFSDSFMSLPAYSTDPRQVEATHKVEFPWHARLKWWEKLQYMHELRPDEHPSYLILSGLALADLIAAKQYIRGLGLLKC